VKRSFILLFLHFLFKCLFPINLYAASDVVKDDTFKLNYALPQIYVIEAIKVVGVKTLDKEVILALVGIKKGDVLQIPGDTIRGAIENLWKQRLIDNVSIAATKVMGNRLTLVIKITEKPRLSNYTFLGIKDKDIEKLVEKTNLIKGTVVTEEFKRRTQKKIQQYFLEKGFLYATVVITSLWEKNLPNNVQWTIKVEKGKQFAVRRLHLEGNHSLSSREIKTTMKNIKEKLRGTFLKYLARDFITLRPFRQGGIFRRKINVSETSNYVEDAIARIMPSHFTKAAYEEDKKHILALYHSKGFRDAKIVEDAIEKYDTETLNIRMKIKEGKPYFIGNVTWLGNSLYDDARLTKILSLQKGALYDLEHIQRKLQFPAESVSELYRNAGHLFVQIEAVEVRVKGHLVDLEIRIQEGPLAYINKIIIKGNTITKEHIIRRALRTLPGDKFTMHNFLRSQRELVQLDIFDPKHIQAEPIPNPEEKTVDIEYTVKERFKGMLNFSLKRGEKGWEPILAFELGNFSLRNLFLPKKGLPFALGDNQKLALSVTKVKNYSDFSLSFSDPWIGGKRAISLGFSIHSAYRNKEVENKETDEEAETNGYTTENIKDQRMRDKRRGKLPFTENDKDKKTPTGSLVSKNDKDEITRERNALPGKLNTKGFSFHMGKRLSWPDDYFVINGAISYERHVYKNYQLLGEEEEKLSGTANELVLQPSIERNSVDNPIYPTQGSIIGLYAKLTPPYSLFSNKIYASDKDRLKWIEYHQWLFDASFFVKIIGSLVLNGRGHLGLLGGYSANYGIGPFNRFYLGGDGMAVGNRNPVINSESIGLRGYPAQHLPAQKDVEQVQGGVFYNKLVLELRYPIVQKSLLNVYILTFAEAGNAWADYTDIKLHQLKKSVGFGIRAALPMLGMVGVDWGFGLDRGKGKITPEMQITVGLQKR